MCLYQLLLFFFNDTATTEIYTLSLHDALPIYDVVAATLGKNVLWVRVRIFAIGGGIIGLAGSMHGFYYQYIDPTQFTNIVIAYAFMAGIARGRGARKGAGFRGAAGGGGARGGGVF